MNFNRRRFIFASLASSVLIGKAHAQRGKIVKGGIQFIGSAVKGGIRFFKTVGVRVGGRSIRIGKNWLVVPAVVGVGLRCAVTFSMTLANPASSIISGATAKMTVRDASTGKIEARRNLGTLYLPPNWRGSFDYDVVVTDEVEPGHKEIIVEIQNEGQTLEIVENLVILSGNEFDRVKKKFDNAIDDFCTS